MFSKFIDWRIFIGSFLVGLIFVWLAAPDTTTINVFPTPDNMNKFIYRDKAGNCFKYKMKEVMCPDNEDDIKTIPVQDGHALDEEKKEEKEVSGLKVKVGDKTINKI